MARASVVVGTLVALAGTTALAASRTVDVENVRVGFQDRYKVGTWTPVWIQLRGGVDGFNGLLEVVAQDEDGTPTTTRQVIQVSPSETKRITAYVRPGSMDPDFATLRFIDGQSLRRVANDVVIGNFMGNKPPESLRRRIIRSFRWVVRWAST